MSMKSVAVKEFPNPRHLSEIYQSTGFHFAFASGPKYKDGRVQCHEWAKCRDFLPDAARAMLTEKPCGIFGFTYDAKKNPTIDMARTRMLVTFKGVDLDVKAFEKKLLNGLAIAHHYEKMAGATLSRLYAVTGHKDENVYMFFGPGLWMSSPFFISMYTFLIRLGDKELQFKNNEELRAALKKLYEEKKAGKAYGNDNDANYIQYSWDKLDVIIKNRKKLFPEKDGYHDIFFMGHSIDAFHNKTGVVALAQANTPDSKLNERAKEVFKL
jgi:hypothetical protein